MIRLEFDGADELIADMQKLVSDYPKEASDALFEVAENFNEDVNAKMPGSYGNKIRKWKIAGAKEGISSICNEHQPGSSFSFSRKRTRKIRFSRALYRRLCSRTALCRADASRVPGEISRAYIREN